jgi:hypothetical protein
MLRQAPKKRAFASVLECLFWTSHWFAAFAPSVLIKNARATALIRAHCAISFALCSNELFLPDLR